MWPDLKPFPSDKRVYTMSNAYAYGICIRNAYGSDDVASEAARYVGDIVDIREAE